MPALYPIRRLLPTLAVPVLVACNASTPPPAPGEPWSHAAEETFQAAEVMKYSLEQNDLERERLRQLGVDPRPPAPAR